MLWRIKDRKNGAEFLFNTDADTADVVYTELAEEGLGGRSDVQVLGLEIPEK